MTAAASSGEEQDFVCPHCKKPFHGELIHGAAPRYEGFKCPHCRLFIPAERLDATEPAPPPD